MRGLHKTIGWEINATNSGGWGYGGCAKRTAGSVIAKTIADDYRPDGRAGREIQLCGMGRAGDRLEMKQERNGDDGDGQPRNGRHGWR